MKCEVDYNYNEKDQILIRTFSGTIQISDMLSSWVKTIYHKLTLYECKGIITDFMQANINIEVDEIEVLEKLFLDNYETLKHIKIAQITDSTKVILPLLFKNKHPEFQLCPFSTKEAAYNWVTTQN